jgi:hypothetical protein
VQKLLLLLLATRGLQNSKISGWHADVQKLLLLLLATQDLAGQDPLMDPRGDMRESKQQAENRRMAGWMRCPSGWMTGRILGKLLSSFTIYNLFNSSNNPLG